MNLLKTAIAISVCVLAATAQTPANRAIGEVASVDADGSRIVIRGDKGGEVQVNLNEKTLFLRVPPGEKDLQKASRIKLADIAPGDRVLARGTVSDDGSSVAATAVIVMSRAELAQKQERDRAEWQSRGAAGKVTSIDQAKRKMEVQGGTPGAPPVTVEWSEKTQFHRYAPESVRFADARPGTAADIQPGDQVRVLGDKSEGAMRAEQVVSGSFRQVAGTVASVNAQQQELRITDLATKKPLVVRLTPDTNFKRMPEEIAARMGKRAADARAPGRAPDLQSAIEKWQPFSVTDLKPGDALIVAGSAGTETGRVTAVTLIAGVEPLLTASPERAANLGGWNFGEIALPQ